MQIQKQVVLANYTWWKVGGVADHFCLPETTTDIEEALLWADKEHVPITVIGGGSNILVSDDGVEGLVICLKNFSQVESVEKKDRLSVTAYAGTLKAEVLKPFLQEKLAPALFLCGLPGDMAGGVVMNAGV